MLYANTTGRCLFVLHSSSRAVGAFPITASNVSSEKINNNRASCYLCCDVHASSYTMHALGTA